MSDNVTSPAHYAAGGMEPIDYLKMKLTPEEFAGFCKGNVIKYLSRANHKNGEEDLKKAAFYARFLAGDDPRKKSSEPATTPCAGTYGSLDELRQIITTAEQEDKVVLIVPDGHTGAVPTSGDYRIVLLTDIEQHMMSGWRIRKAYQL